MLASPWMTPGGRVNSRLGVGVLHLGQHGGEEGPVAGVSQVFASIRWAALANGASSGRCRSSGAVSWCSLAQDLGDLGDAGVLVAVVGDGFPEGDDVPVDDDRLIDIHHAHGRVVDGLQPPGDGYCPADLIGVSAGTGDPGDDGGLQPVDRVGADPQQAGTVGIDPGDRAGPLEDVLGIVHPRMDRRAPAGMRSR